MERKGRNLKHNLPRQEELPDAAVIRRRRALRALVECEGWTHVKEWVKDQLLGSKRPPLPVAPQVFLAYITGSIIRDVTELFIEVVEEEAALAPKGDD